MYRQMELVLGVFVALTGGVSLLLGVSERRNMPSFPWPLVTAASLLGFGAAMIFGAVTERNVELVRAAFLALVLIATVMTVITQRRAK